LNFATLGSTIPASPGKVVSMSSPQSCPFCESRDIRMLTASGLDLTGYRCHDCQGTFYVAAVAIRPPVEAEARRPKNPGPKDGRRDRK
jgi:hypothetical protein